jgi:hypothetical protein
MACFDTMIMTQVLRQFQGLRCLKLVFF